MKSWKGIALVALLLVCPSLYAQSDMTVYASFMEMDENVFEDDVALEFDSGKGFGIGLNKFWGNHISTEIAAFALRSDGVLALEGEPIIDTGSLDMIPVTLTVQFHLGRDARFDPYIGVGAAYVITDDLQSDDLDSVEIGAVEIDDEVTWVANAGFAFGITDTFALVLDGRYIALEPSSSSATEIEEEEQDVPLELNPIIASIGLRWRF